MLWAPHPYSQASKFNTCPYVLYKHLDSAYGLSLPFGSQAEKCLRENSPGNNPQPMTEKQWTFHFRPSRTTEILHCLFWLHRGIDPQWPRPVTYLKMHHLLGSAFSQSHTLIFCLSSASIQAYCNLIIVSGLALRKVPTKIFIIFSEEIQQCMILWMREFVNQTQKTYTQPNYITQSNL